MLIWKKIDDYDYSVNENGQIKNNKTNKILTTRLSCGYNRVRLYSNGLGKNILVHRLVGEYFCKKNDGSTQINHIDGNKLNNHYRNLEWTTPSSNGLHKCYVLGKSIKSINLVKNGKIYRFQSIKSAAEILNLDRGNLSRLLNGKRKSLNGYKKII